MTSSLRLIVPFLATSCALAACKQLSQSKTSGTIDPTVYLGEARWLTSAIPVCWEAVTKEEEAMAAFVQAAVVEAYSKTVVEFVGWELCPAEFDGVRLYIHQAGRPSPDRVDEYPGHPRASSIGRSAKNFIVLNFEFDEVFPWLKEACAGKPDDAIKNCIKNSALHEFGHILGLLHEQTRRDSLCTDEGPDVREGGGLTYGPFDPESIMNYCWTHPNATKTLALSPQDIKTINSLFQGLDSNVATSGGPLKGFRSDSDSLPKWDRVDGNRATWEYECSLSDGRYAFIFTKEITVSEIVDRFAPTCEGWSRFSSECSSVINSVSKVPVECSVGLLGLKAYTE